MLPHLDAATEVSLIREALAHGQTLRFRVSSGSMFPTLYVDDVVLITGEAPHTGEIAFARVEERWVVHRVVAQTKSDYTLRGDFDLEGAGHRVATSNVAGKVLKASPTRASRSHRRRAGNLLKAARYQLRKWRGGHS